MRSLVLFALLSAASFAQTVRFETSQGDIDVILAPESAPATVQNFLNYVNRGAYNNTFFHRLVRGFVAQAGGYRWQTATPNVVEIPEDPPVRNEFRISNTRGTIAMAKLGSGPNTATKEWFFNLADNSRNLNAQNGGFTVFGRIADNASFTVLDKIAAAPIFNAGAPFDSLPLVDFAGGTAAVQERNLLLVRSIRLLRPEISDGGVITASAFGGFRRAAMGSFVEIYGTGLAGSTSRSWTGADFRDGVAPTALNQVSVTMNGVPAYVNFVSAGQVNVQVPDGLPEGDVNVVLKYRDEETASVPLRIERLAPGMLAPSRFKVGDKQFVVALHADGRIVSNGTLPDARTAAPAEPGETLILFGTGFGPVTPEVLAGRAAEVATQVNARVQFFFGDAEAPVSYAGLVPGVVGLYQFNIVVPQAATQFLNADGDARLYVLVNFDEIEQRGMLIPVKR